MGCRRNVRYSVQANTVINAMNELIKSLKGGIEDKSFEINWNKFFNRLILYRDNTLKIIPLKLKKIIEL